MNLQEISQRHDRELTLREKVCIWQDAIGPVQIDAARYDKPAQMHGPEPCEMSKRQLILFNWRSFWSVT